jgi:hypothetical protein
MERDAIHRGRHAMLSDAIMHVGAFVLPRLDLNWFLALVLLDE